MNGKSKIWRIAELFREVERFWKKVILRSTKEYDKPIKRARVSGNFSLCRDA
jgi:hypothetical protein